MIEEEFQSPVEEAVSSLEDISYIYDVNDIYNNIESAKEELGKYI